MALALWLHLHAIQHGVRRLLFPGAGIAVTLRIRIRVSSIRIATPGQMAYGFLVVVRDTATVMHRESPEDGVNFARIGG